MNDAMAGKACLALLLGLMVEACNWVGQGVANAQATPQNGALPGHPLTQTCAPVPGLGGEDGDLVARPVDVVET